jgi:putative membrane protein
MRISILRKIKRTLIVTTTTLTCVLPVWSQTPEPAAVTPNTPNTTDQIQTKADHKTTAFLKEAARDNDAEIGLAEVGARQAQNADLKSYCEMLQKNHAQANKDLAAIAQKYGVGNSDAPTRRDQKEVAKFEKLTGTEFDQKFAEQMLTDHQKAISKYDKASQEIQSADVKQYAETMLPKLREHFQKAADIARTVGVDPSTISTITKKLPAVGGTIETIESSHGASEKIKQEDTSKVLQKDQIPKP